MSDFAPPIGVPPAIQFVAVDRLCIDEDYQRSIDTSTSRKLIEAIAAGWDWRLCLPLLVAARADGLYVIDGQHRWRAAQMRGDLPHLPACVMAFASPAEEAALFVAANRGRKAMTRLDDFRAALVAGDAETVQIAALLADAGLAMAANARGSGVNVGEVGFTIALTRALRQYGPATVEAALQALGAAFSNQVLGAIGGALFGALILLRARLDDELEEVIVALKTHSAAEWATHPELNRGSCGERARSLRDVIVRELRANGNPVPIAATSSRLIDLSLAPSAMEQRFSQEARA